MIVISTNRHRPSRKAIALAVAVLRAGGVVAYPTDTAYGLAADSGNPSAIKKIFNIKSRERGKPLPLIAASLRQAGGMAVLRGELARLARRHWPGPLTVVAPRRPAVGQAAAGGAKTVAIRVPASLLARALAEAVGRPITSTSANLSGHPAPYSGATVRKEFSGRRASPDLLLDAGRLPPRPVSTIIAAVRGKIKVLRQGAIRI